MKSITFTVTNDLTYDQRMHRICTSLATHGYRVLLVGRKLKNSAPLTNKLYNQKRLYCWFTTGKLMYVEYNIKLLFFLLFTKTDCYCAIDLDTIIPNLLSAVVKGKHRVYDAHELFTEQKEIVTRRWIKRIWTVVEQITVPRYTHGYTVNEFIASEFYRRYKVEYKVIRNLPVLTDLTANKQKTQKFIIYQGAVNEGRSFETLIPAMRQVPAKLIICGNGNFFDRVKQLIETHNLQNKVELTGMVLPEKLKSITPTAYLAVMLFEATGLNQYQSLANRFFDYIMAGVPQVCVNYPQYKTINDQYQVACLIDNTNSDTIANALNNLLENDVYYNKLYNNCLVARQELNWQREEKQLLNFYSDLFVS